MASFHLHCPFISWKLIDMNSSLWWIGRWQWSQLLKSHYTVRRKCWHVRIHWLCPVRKKARSGHWTTTTAATQPSSLCVCQRCISNKDCENQLAKSRHWLCFTVFLMVKPTINHHNKKGPRRWVLEQTLAYNATCLRSAKCTFSVSTLLTLYNQIISNKLLKRVLG